MKKNILTSALAVVVLFATTAFTTLKDKMKGKELRGGEFTMDMTSINVTDLSGDSKGKLEGHLKSDDFFGIANHPTATLVFTGLSGEEGVYNVIADLTIKGQTHPVSFELKIDGKTANTSLKINRTKYGIKYGSGSFFDNLGDKAINDEFELNVSLEF